MTKEKPFYGMRNDYMFHAVLQSNQAVLKNLVAALMNLEEDQIQSCTLENPIVLGKSIDSKDCILDIRLLLNDQKRINIELQIKAQEYWPDRSLLYWSRTYDILKTGENYDKLLPTCQIGILDFSLFKDKPEFFEEFRLLSTSHNRAFTDKISIRVLDLTMLDHIKEQIKSDQKEGISCTINPKLIKWAEIFKAKTLKELENLLNDQEEVYREMLFTIKQLSEDEQIRMQCEAREDYYRCLSTEHSLGVKEGIEQATTEFIKRLLQNNYSENAIIELGYTKEQIEQAKASN